MIGECGRQPGRGHPSNLLEPRVIQRHQGPGGCGGIDYVAYDKRQNRRDVNLRPQLPPELQQRPQAAVRIAEARYRLEGVAPPASRYRGRHELILPRRPRLTRPKVPWLDRRLSDLAPPA